MKVKELPMQVNYLKTIGSLSMIYHNMDISMILTNNNSIEFSEIHITKCLLLLPESLRTGYTNTKESSLYYIIISEWNELKEYMQSRRPTSPRYEY